MLVSRDWTMRGERQVGVGPAQRLDGQEAFNRGGQLRQHRFERERQQAEGFETDRAGFVQAYRIGRVFSLVPRLGAVDIGIDAVGQFHHLTQRAAIVAAFVQRGDLRQSGTQRVEQRMIHGAVLHARVETLDQEAGCAAGDVDVFADQIAVDPSDKIIEIQIEIFHRAVELGGKVITQPLGVQAAVDHALRSDKGPARFRHFGAVNREEAVGKNVGRRAMAGKLQHRGPEQRVEIENVLADEMVLLGGGIGRDPLVEIHATLLAEILKASVVTDRRIEPDIKIFARSAWDLEAEIRRVARNIPIRELGVAVVAQPFAHLVGRFGLCQPCHPFAQKRFAARVGKPEEIMGRCLVYRRGARDHRERIDQVGRLVGRAAHFA